MSYKILEEDWNGQFYLKLESDFPSQIRNVRLKGITIIETITSGSPMFILTFMDGQGDLITNTYISPNDIYYLTLGNTADTAQKNSFSLSTNAAKSTNMHTTNTDNSIIFVSDKWEKMFKDTFSRSWRDDYYSTVASDIASEVGFKKINVEQTDIKHNVIQPYWTNYQLLKWLMNHAKNSEGISGYDMLFYINGDFGFKTYNSLFAQKPYDSYIIGENSTQHKPILGFNIKQDYMPTLLQGGFGETYTYFDFESGEFVTGQAKQSQMNQTQLADWFFLSQAQETAPKQVYGARDTEVGNMAENRVTSVTNAVQKMNVTIYGDPLIHIGDIINLIIHPNGDNSKIINEYYSGYWMISKVTHDIDFKNHQYITRLELSRSGINGKGITGLVKSQAGKKVSPKSIG